MMNQLLAKWNKNQQAVVGHELRAKAELHFSMGTSTGQGGIIRLSTPSVDARICVVAQKIIGSTLGENRRH